MSKSKVPYENYYNITRSYVEKIIDERCFNKKYREILKLRFLDELTFDEIAEEKEMSSRQIQNIVYDQGNKILDIIDADLCKI